MLISRASLTWSHYVRVATIISLGMFAVMYFYTAGERWEKISSIASAAGVELYAPSPESDPASASATPPLFLLVGDSTTNDQLHAGGGWGGAFSWLLVRGADAANHGLNGATTTGYINSWLWSIVLDEVRGNATSRKVYVTIQFGHNDQMPGSNVNLEQTQANLALMAREVLAAGGTPILVSPLCRRDFGIDGVTIIDNLADYRNATLQAYEQVLREANDGTIASTVQAANRPRFINLNAASLAYCGSIGKKASYRYNKVNFLGDDTTHLNEHGAIIFGRMVADLILGHPPELVPRGQKDKWAPGRGNDDDGLSGWIEPNPYLTGRIWHGEPA